jgi:hypothetical protein
VEIPSGESEPLVKELQTRFNPIYCDTIRENARLLYEAMSNAASACNSPLHQGIFWLDWHMERTPAPGKFTIAILAPQVELWNTLRVRFPEPLDQQPCHQERSPSRKRPHSSRSPSPNQKLTWKRRFRPPPDRTLPVVFESMTIGLLSQTLAHFGQIKTAFVLRFCCLY